MGFVHVARAIVAKLAMTLKQPTGLGRRSPTWLEAKRCREKAAAHAEVNPRYRIISIAHLRTGTHVLPSRSCSMNLADANAEWLRFVASAVVQTSRGYFPVANPLETAS